MLIILSDNCPSSDIGDARFSPSVPNTRVISLCTIVWCWDTPSSLVCIGFTATRFLQKHSTAVTDWTLSWFGRQLSTMELLLCRRKQSGMPEYCFCSQPLLRQTLGPSPSTVHLCRRWKHTTILKMVVSCIIRIIHITFIIRIIRIIFIILFRQDGWGRLDPRLYTSLTTENQSCMSSLLNISWENFRLCQLGTQARFSNTCTTCFQEHLATAGRVLAMDAGCGS